MSHARFDAMDLSELPPTAGQVVLPQPQPPVAPWYKPVPLPVRAGEPAATTGALAVPKKRKRMGTHIITLGSALATVVAIAGLSKGRRSFNKLGQKWERHGQMW
jgi:hypothetical protein